MRVVLVRARNPLNIGAAARAMSNFGLAHLRVVQSHGPSFREARSAVGAADVLAGAKEYDSIADAVADCGLVVGTTSVGQRQLQQPLKDLLAGTQLIRKHLATGSVALLFGSEKIGLRNEDLSHCHWLMRIPTREEHRSMNLGQAVAVCLYELVRNDRPGPNRPPHIRSGRKQGHSAADLTSRSPTGRTKASMIDSSATPGDGEATTYATAGQLERLTDTLLESLQTSEYLKSRSATNEEKIRRLVHRLNLSPQDAETLVGMLRQILWKMNPDPKR